MEEKPKNLGREQLGESLVNGQKTWWGRLVIALFGYCASAPLARAKAFDLRELPHGKDVTINRPATTNIPLEERVKLTATDSPQTIRFQVLSNSGKIFPIHVAIFDSHQDKVRYLTVKPGQVSLYSFKGLSSIFVLPKLGEHKAPAGKMAKGKVTVGSSRGQNKAIYLQVASDKPLNIAH